ncbi:hypothetical protein PRZ48_005294 [Zasmidium cellare]|uniref:Structure-specific endonuclease subunit SLX4 n=1 Tax=Zasmidium cellare TaxID=395010 RepID=A0ABR0ET72_ZASCE|nr:hypothetical protein PRZ48_005294 [Zasmidium cellare]
MASRSPIVVNSSSQASFRIPSVTPQSHRKKSDAALSSSPGLVELPTFAQVPAQGLKSGLNARQAPEGAALGFSSAATLLKKAQDEAQLKKQEKRDVSNGAGDDGVDTKVAGKLTKPRRTEKSGKEGKKRGDGSKQPSLQNGGDGQRGSKTSGTGEACPYFGQPKARTPSISLSEYDFRPEEHQGSPASKPAPLKPAKKPRQRTAKTDKAGKENATEKPRKRTTASAKAATDATATKPKKRFTKSESIILNSDEPDVDNNDSNTTVDRLDKVEAEAPRIGFPVEKPIQSDRTLATVTDIDASAYFSEQPIGMADAQASRQGNDGSSGSPPAMDPSTALPTLVAAPRRRLSWTPAKNTALRKTSPDIRPGTASSAGSDAPSKSLASLISGFGYSEQAAAAVSPKRTSTGEALTKKRRIELADANTVAPAKYKAAPAVPSEPTKKAKIKKKPQTITALATKAYNHDDDGTNAQPTVSEFFDAQTSAVPPTDIRGTHPEEPKKLTKPRKPRAKKADDGTTQPATKKARKGKVKDKSNEKDYMAKLHSPGRARAQEQSQDFLYGTSSQLVLEESPTFIREVQAAILESEAMPTSQTGNLSTNKSSVQVPSAPHGTNLSLGQARRELWCSATRDDGGDFLDVDTVWERRRSNNHSAPAKAVATLPVTTTMDALTGDADTPNPPQRSPVSQNGNALYGPRSPRKAQHDSYDTAIDLCQTSPPTDEPKAESNTVVNFQDQIDAVADQEPAAASSPPQNRFDDDWAVLSSDDSPPNAALNVPKPLSVRSGSPSPVQTSKPPQLLRSATSPSIHRTALQSLDANIGLLSHTSLLKNTVSSQQRHLTSTTADQARRPRGRPRKSSATGTAALNSPKRRGRPPKATVDLEVAAAASFESHRATVRQGKSASQPAESNAWVNIDEISDSDSPSTPSPPRRRAGSSPPTVQPLDLSIAASPSLKAKAPAVVSSALKLNDSTFTDIQADLFTRITATVRSTPPSTDMKNPTWHEKILLYDPIVLEDLAAWLNEQGLCIEMQRLKQKPKSRGRKKKDAPAEEPEYETVKEELKPWMVQKWCEEKSICCLWKEGLRGGVRTRY